MGNSHPNRSFAGVATALVVTGFGIGWLAGLSVSPVVSIVITSVTGVAAAVVTALSGLKEDATVPKPQECRRPTQNRLGRPMKLDLREVINSILYVVRNGVAWANAPPDLLNPNSIYYHFRKWCLDGTWRDLNEALRRYDRA